jgi:hypothetical protein
MSPCAAISQSWFATASTAAGGVTRMLSELFAFCIFAFATGVDDMKRGPARPAAPPATRSGTLRVRVRPTAASRRAKAIVT